MVFVIKPLVINFSITTKEIAAVLNVKLISELLTFLNDASDFAVPGHLPCKRF